MSKFQMSSPFVRWAYTLGCILPLSKVEKSEDVKPGSWRLEVHHLLQAGVGGDSGSFTTTTTLNRGQGVYPKHQSPWTTRTAAIEIQMFLRQFLVSGRIQYLHAPRKRGVLTRFLGSFFLDAFVLAQKVR